jgi:hypothetical protein
LMATLAPCSVFCTNSQELHQKQDVQERGRSDRALTHKTTRKRVCGPRRARTSRWCASTPPPPGPHTPFRTGKLASHSCRRFKTGGRPRRRARQTPLMHHPALVLPVSMPLRRPGALPQSPHMSGPPNRFKGMHAAFLSNHPASLHLAAAAGASARLLSAAAAADGGGDDTLGAFTNAAAMRGGGGGGRKEDSSSVAGLPSPEETARVALQELGA